MGDIYEETKYAIDIICTAVDMDLIQSESIHHFIPLGSVYVLKTT